MKTAYEIVLRIHIFFGFIGLLTFWVAAFAKKGAKLHIKVGTVFAYAMFAVSVTSFVMAAIVLVYPLVIHPDWTPDKARSFDTFLFYLGVFTFCSAWNGIRVIKFKNSLVRLGSLGDRILNFLPGLIGVGVCYLGILQHDYLMMVFGGLGPLSVFGHFKSLQKLLAKSGETPITFHIQSMLGGGIGVHTAFFAGGAMTRYFPWLQERTGYFFWIAPSIVGSFFIARMIKKYSPNPVASRI